MALNYWLVVVRPRRCAAGDVCHVDSPLMRFNRRVFWISAAVFVIALVLTYGSLFVLVWQRSDPDRSVGIRVSYFFWLN